MASKKINSVVLYNGPSMIDGTPIVVIATDNSKNSKTGAGLIQTWIIRSDIDPISANRTGADYGICGDCPHRGTPNEKGKGTATARSCYVLLMGPNAIYKAYHKGKYRDATDVADIEAYGEGKGIRIGSYGDGAAVPGYVWEAILKKAKFNTGYTHNGGNTDYCMVSADTLTDAESAWSKGDRTFRVISDVSEIVKGKEILCPGSVEAGNKSTCDKCKLCDGNKTRAPSIAIVAHGTGKKHVAATPVARKIIPIRIAS